jgi:hypothetical protein
MLAALPSFPPPTVPEFPPPTVPGPLPIEEALAVAGALGLPVTLALVARGRGVAGAAVRLAATLPDRAWLGLDLAALGLGADAQRCRADLARIVEALPAGAWLQLSAGDPGLVSRAAEVALALTDETAPVVATVPATHPGLARPLVDAEVPIRLTGGPALPYARLAERLAAEGARPLLATTDAPLRALLLSTLGRLDVELTDPSAAYDPVTRQTAVRVLLPVRAAALGPAATSAMASALHPALMGG